MSLFGDARLPDRFWEKVLNHPASGCWEWQAARDQKGYGRFRWKGFTRRAHRVAYEELVAPVPDGLQLDHLCRNPFCCAPWHLEPVTPRENTLRGESIQAANARKTHCPRGHVLVPLHGQRGCPECRRAQDRARKRRTRSLAYFSSAAPTPSSSPPTG